MKSLSCEVVGETYLKPGEIYEVEFNYTQRSIEFQTTYSIDELNLDINH